MLNRRHFTAALAATLPWAGAARAQTYPSKPVTLLVAYPAGGPGDMMARTLGETLAERLGQPVLVDNRPGAGGQIAAPVLLAAPADGHTLLLGDTSTLGINRALYRKFNYDPVTDMEAVSPMLRMPMVLFVPKASPFNTLADLVAASKARSLNYASQGGGSAGHLLGEMLRAATGGQFNHVPYKGSAPAMIDLLGGQVDLLFDGIGPGLQHLAAQKIKAIAIAGPQRLPQIPEVATTAEGGLPDVALSIWFGVVARAGTPAATVKRLNTEVAYAMKQPKAVKRFGDLGFQFLSMSPAEFGSFIKHESEHWGAFVKARQIVLD